MIKSIAKYLGKWMKWIKCWREKERKCRLMEMKMRSRPGRKN
jgi:hypothetical protein